MSRLVAALALASLLITAGCTAIAPAQLVDARRAWDTSNKGQTGRLNPTDLYEAKKSLDQANAEFEANGDTMVARDYAYIAMRKVQLADAVARTTIDQQTITAAAKQGKLHFLLVGGGPAENGFFFGGCGGDRVQADQGAVVDCENERGRCGEGGLAGESEAHGRIGVGG